MLQKLYLNTSLREFFLNLIVVFQLPSHVWLFVTPMDCSTPGLPVPHHLPEFSQVHVYWISDVIQPSHPLTLFSFCPPSFPGSGTFLMSWLFTLYCQNTGASASVLLMSIQHWFPLRLTSLISLQSKGLSGVFSALQFEGINYLVFCLFYGPGLTAILEEGMANHLSILAVRPSYTI